MSEDGDERCYRIRVGFLPDFPAMEARFGRGNIVNLVSTEHGSWLEDPSHAGDQECLDTALEEIIIVVKALEDMESEEDLMRWAEGKGCVPCDRREIYAFAVDDTTRDLEAGLYFAYGESFSGKTEPESIPVFIKDPEQGDQLGLARRYAYRSPHDRFLFKKKEKKE